MQAHQSLFSMTLLRRCLVVATLCALAAIAHAQEACASQPPQVTQAFAKSRPPMQYCFATIGGQPVLWLYGGLGENSFNNVARGLRQTTRYREVWLNSPGGSVTEAFQIGLELKRLQATAVVPAHDGVRCVSACTILILGAYNRTIEPGADFMIHAKSAYSQGAESAPWNKTMTWGQVAAVAVKEPRELEGLTQGITSKERSKSTEYVVYVMKAIGGTPNDALFGQLSMQPLPGPYAKDAPQPRKLAVDVSLLATTGAQALQEILTQAELRAMDLMHERMLARQTELGRGASVALRIFKANLACRIQDVCRLEQHQLENLGYHNFTPDRLAGRR
jgi:hypothetical protein